MAITWNSTTLKVLVNSDWNPGAPSTNINETALLPNSADLSAIASVIQQGSTKRRRAVGKLYVTSMIDYNSLAAAYLAGTVSTLADGDTLNASYLIEALGPPEYKQGDCIFCDIVFVEV